MRIIAGLVAPFALPPLVCLCLLGCSGETDVNDRTEEISPVLVGAGPETHNQTQPGNQTNVEQSDDLADSGSRQNDGSAVLSPPPTQQQASQPPPTQQTARATPGEAQCAEQSFKGPVVGKYRTFAEYEGQFGSRMIHEYAKWTGPQAIFDFFNEKRASYFDQNDHDFGPRQLGHSQDYQNDAQQIANELAAACQNAQPRGERQGAADSDPYWIERTSNGRLIVTGLAHKAAGLTQKYFAAYLGPFLFFSNNDATWRECVLRRDGASHLGVGLAPVDDNQSWVVFVLDAGQTCFFGI